MKTEFLPDGSPDCPLLRLYDFDTAQACHLQRLVSDLAAGAVNEVSLQQFLAVEAIAGCCLTLQVGAEDQGIMRDTQSGAFICRLRRSSWERVGELISPFCGQDLAEGFQWLDETSRISWLLSPHGSW